MMGGLRIKLSAVMHQKIQLFPFLFEAEQFLIISSFFNCKQHYTVFLLEELFEMQKV